MDAASTALFSMGLDDAKIYLNQINAEAVFYEVGTTNIEISKITSFSEKVKTSRLVESAPKKRSRQIYRIRNYDCSIRNNYLFCG